MKLEIDSEVDGAYVWFREHEVVSTMALDSQRIVDYDAHGEVIGIELLAIHQGVDVHNLPRSEEIAQLFKEHGIPIYA